ncbi:MAG: hypothetical protein ACM3TR_09980 [Caulobacteraceae bacterium]
MNDRWDVKCREVYMDNSQKYQIWLNGIVVGEVMNRFDAVEKLQNVFEQVEAQQQEIEQLKDAIKIYSESAKTWETGYGQLQAQVATYKDFILELIRRFEETPLDADGTHRLTVDRTFLVEAKVALTHAKQNGCEKKPTVPGKGMQWGYDAQQNHHNPADVEALKQVKRHIENFTLTGIMDELDCAIAEIDKQIGGRDNG